MDKNEAAKIKVGEYVAFKYDVEQTAKVMAIRADRWRGIEFQVRAEEGGYVEEHGGPVTMWIDAAQCW